MRRVSQSVLIASGPEPVWRLLSEPERYPEYVPAAQRLLDTSHQTVEVGSTYREYGGVPPFHAESTWVVTEVEPMTHQHHDGDDGKVRMPLDLDVEVVDEGTTRLTISFALEPRWFLQVPFALLWPAMMRRRAQQVVDDTVANAKRIVEAELVA